MEKLIYMNHGEDNQSRLRRTCSAKDEHLDDPSCHVSSLQDISEHRVLALLISTFRYMSLILVAQLLALGLQLG